jgi:FtsP/CotA-like multicopper oxidase with cupredoxin domain
MSSTMGRRRFLEVAGGGVCAAATQLVLRGVGEVAKADVTLRIGEVGLEIAPGKTIKTVGYNGAVPGPFLRFREGQNVIVDVVNETKEAELVHWHGMFLAPVVDGSAEEGTPLIAPGKTQRYSFAARPAGTRWYHTHVAAGRNLKKALFSGQYGMVYVEPSGEPGAYDAVHSLCLHGWQPYLATMGAEGSMEAVYQSFSINDRALGHGVPIRVKSGQRVMFRIVNASATMQHSLALAGHSMTVMSLDGNAVPKPQAVDMITLGPAERADVVVTMNTPGVWILGEVDDQMRSKGMGVVVAYENRSETAAWVAPSSRGWDYTLFGGDIGTEEPAEVVPLVFRPKFAGNNWVDHWTINGKEFPKTDEIRVQEGKRYRLRFDNQSDDDHPVHLHRHTFELKDVAGKKTTGVRKDVVVVPRRKVVEAEFVAEHPGLTLFHCHQQLHMDYGFMALMRYV